jgi:hypothetical protein
MKTSNRQILFVLGMGRSGTSVLTRVLSLCGGRLPENLLGATEANPTGHWEPMDVLMLNIRFMERHGSTWFDPTLRLQSNCCVNEDDKEEYVGQIRELLETFPREPFLIIKEPRIASLAEYWFEACDRADFNISIVIPVRHPDEVSMSLAARDGVSAELSGMLWLKYNLLAERHSRRFRRVFVEYPNLIADWRREVRRISDDLEIEMNPINEHIDQFIVGKLHRQRSNVKPRDMFSQGWIGQVYASLSAASRGESLDEALLDSVFSGFQSNEHMFRVSRDDYQTRFAPKPSPAQ